MISRIFAIFYSLINFLEGRKNYNLQNFLLVYKKYVTFFSDLQNVYMYRRNFFWANVQPFLLLHTKYDLPKCFMHLYRRSFY